MSQLKVTKDTAFVNGIILNKLFQYKVVRIVFNENLREN